MKSVFHKALVVAALSAVSLCAAAADKKEAAKEPVVKKSDSGICHDASSASFANTKKFTPFNSLDECVKSGGKLPGGTAAAAPAEVVKKSDSGICHDKTSPHYEKTKKFTEFKSMDECVKSGGKPPKK